MQQRHTAMHHKGYYTLIFIHNNNNTTDIFSDLSFFSFSFFCVFFLFFLFFSLLSILFILALILNLQPKLSLTTPLLVVNVQSSMNELHTLRNNNTLGPAGQLTPAPYVNEYTHLHTFGFPVSEVPFLTPWVVSIWPKQVRA